MASTSIFRAPAAGAALLLAGALAGALAAVPAPAQTPAPAAPAPQDTLTLAEALHLGLSGSPEMRAAQAQRALGSANRLASWGQLIPSVSLSTGVNQNAVLQRTATDPITGGIISLPDSLIDVRTAYGTAAQLNVTWTVFDGGRRLWGIRQAEAETRAANLSLLASRARVAAGLTTSYLDALEASALAQTRAAELERAQELTRLAEGRFETGAAPQLEVLQARVNEGDAELALAEAESAAEAARLALFAYLPEADADVALAEPPTPDLEAIPAQEELRQCAVEGSAELGALRAQLSAARRVREAQHLSLLPTIFVGGTWIRSEFGMTRDAVTLEPRNEQTYYRVGLQWSPLDQPGQWLAERRRSAANLQAADAELAARQAAVIREVTVALDRLSRAQQQEQKRALNLQLAQAQREQAEERYRLGAGSIVERFQAEALAREAERQAVIARYSALRSLADLERAGGVRVSWESGDWRCSR